MQLNIYIIFLLLLSSANISAQFLLAEDFSGHEIGDPVENAINNTNPDVGEWIFVQETSGSTVPVVVNDQLSYSDYIYSARGKTMYTIPTDGIGNTVFCLSRTHLPYPCQPQGGFVDGSNEFYAAFIMDLSNTTSSDVQEIFSFFQTGSKIRRGCIFYKLSSDKKTIAFSFQKKAEAASSYWTKYYDKTKPFLVVVKYSHVCINEKNLGHSEFEMFINPNPKKTEAENSTLKINAFGNETGYDTDLRYINFRQSGQTSMKVAGIRIANSFEQVLVGPDYNSIGSNVTGNSLLFDVKRNILYPNNDLNGKLSIYDINALPTRSYNAQGGEPVKTDLGPGAYIIMYEEDGNKYIQKILIY